MTTPFSAARQRNANHGAIVYVLVKERAESVDGHWWERKLLALGTGLETQGKLLQIYGILAASFWDQHYSARLDGSYDVEAARNELLLLASSPANAHSPELHNAARRGNKAHSSFSRGPSKSTQALTDLLDLMLANGCVCVNSGDAFKSLNREFSRATKWATSLGVTIDNMGELKALLDKLEQAHQVMLLDTVETASL